MTFRFLGLTLLLGGAALWLSRSPQPVAKPPWHAKLPVYFVENQGQVDARVSYYVHGGNTAAYLTASSVFYALSTAQAKAWVQLDFVDANRNPLVETLGRTTALVSYFRGPREQWKTELSTYSEVTYKDLWPGVDLEFAGPEGLLKYTFHVRPGADPRRIRFAYRGARSVTLTPAGSLHIDTPVGGFADEKPIAWQDTPDGRQPVAAAFSLDDGQVRFEIGAYDPGLPLTIDPVVLLYAGFLGGSGGDDGRGIAVDSAGNAYVTGYTYSNQPTFPVTTGPDLTYNGGGDAFVAKVNATGTALVYAGYLGGSGSDYGHGIAVDSAGNAYVTGFTDSTQATFPVTTGPDLTHNRGNSDAFVTKVNKFPGTAGPVLAP